MTLASLKCLPEKTQGCWKSLVSVPANTWKESRIQSYAAVSKPFLWDQLSLSIFCNFSLPQSTEHPSHPLPEFSSPFKMPHCLCTNLSGAQFRGPISYCNTTSLLYSLTTQETRGTLATVKNPELSQLQKILFPKRDAIWCQSNRWVPSTCLVQATSGKISWRPS